MVAQPMILSEGRYLGANYVIFYAPEQMRKRLKRKWRVKQKFLKITLIKDCNSQLPSF